jgi:hypothetical protein
LYDSGRRDSFAAWQIWRGRPFLEQRFEYGIWPSWHGEYFVEGYYRGSGGFHADRLNAFIAGRDGLAFSFTVNRTGTDTSSRSVASSINRSVDGSGSFARSVAGSFACKFAEVGKTFRVSRF